MKFENLRPCEVRRGGRLCAAVSAEGALRMRHTPCGCCPPDRAKGAELFFDFTGSAIFYSDAVTVPSATISFPSCGKRYGRKGRWTRSIALTREKAFCYVVRVIVTPAVKERPDGRP